MGEGGDLGISSFQNFPGDSNTQAWEQRPYLVGKTKKKKRKITSRCVGGWQIWSRGEWHGTSLSERNRGDRTQGVFSSTDLQQMLWVPQASAWFRTVVLKVLARTSSILISWDLVRNANPEPHLQPAGSETGDQKLLKLSTWYNLPSRWSCCTLKCGNLCYVQKRNEPPRWQGTKMAGGANPKSAFW